MSQRPDRLPFALFLARSDFLFGQMRPLNLSPDPSMISKYLKDHLRTLRLLVEEISKMQKGDPGNFPHVLLVRDPKVFPNIECLNHPDFKKVP
jgi:hypothetical protein